MDDAGSDSDSTAVSCASSGSVKSLASAKGAPAAPAATTTSESVSAEFTLGFQLPTRVCPSIQVPGIGTTGGADTNTPMVKRRVVGLGHSLVM